MSETQEPKKNGDATPPAPEAAVAPEGVAAQADAPPAAPEPSPLEKARAEVGRLKDQFLRTAAELENFRKRARRDVEDARARGRNETLGELLPIFDNLARAAQAAAGATDVAAIQSGIQLVLGQVDGALARVGVTPIEAVGKPFDPTKHDAIQQLDRADVPAGTVVEEVQRGYVNGERLVRAALVVVARAPTPAPAAAEVDPEAPKPGEEPS